MGPPPNAHLPGGTSLPLRRQPEDSAESGRPQAGRTGCPPSKLVLAQPPPPAGCLSLQLLSPGICLPTRLIGALLGGGLELAVGDTTSRTSAGGVGKKKGKGPQEAPRPSAGLC